MNADRKPTSIQAAAFRIGRSPAAMPWPIALPTQVAHDLYRYTVRRGFRSVRPLAGGVAPVTPLACRHPLNIVAFMRYILTMRVLCVGRHPYLSEHLGRFFEKLGVDTIPCVGMADAPALVSAYDPDAIICDYDLLAPTSLPSWQSHSILSRVPLIAVSLTRHPGEAHLFDISGLAGFLYLPTLQPEDAHRVLDAVHRKRGGGGINPPNVLPWPGTTPVARFR